MIDAVSPGPAVSSYDSDFAIFGPVHLDVTDAARSLAFWRDLVGLELLEDQGQAIRLGAGGQDLIILHPGASAPSPRRASGLYHLALHLPSLEEFARVVGRIAVARYPQYPTDHVMHLASYADDPDGNGVELAFETLHRYRSMEFGPNGLEAVHSDGRRTTGRDPVDLNWLFQHIPDGDVRPPLPPGTAVGHLHLRVADIDSALAFYRDVIGFETNMDVPGVGMADMSARGTFPHRLAMNTWESAGRPQRPAGAAGLRYFTLALRSAEELPAMLARVGAAGGSVDRRDGGALVSDPSGNRLLLIT